MTNLSRMFVLIVALFVLAVAAVENMAQTTRSNSGKLLQVTGTVTVNGDQRDFGCDSFLGQHGHDGCAIDCGGVWLI